MGHAVLLFLHICAILSMLYSVMVYFVLIGVVHGRFAWTFVAGVIFNIIDTDVHATIKTESKLRFVFDLLFRIMNYVTAA